MTPRIVCQFSCGAASAVATKLILAEHDPADVVILNAFIQEEDADNRRFLADCERWFEHPVIVLRNEKYNASVFEVWGRKRYIKGRYGAPCSRELKRDLLNGFSLPSDVYVLGYTCEEQDRLDGFLDANNGRRVIAPLIDKNLTHDDCLAMVDRAGIVLPLMYRKGYRNANCPNCPKGGQAYWQNIREDFPNNFVRLSSLQHKLGPGSYFLQFRSGPRKGERMSLAELPPGRGDMKAEPSFSCSFFCEMAEQDISAKIDAIQSTNAEG